MTDVATLVRIHNVYIDTTSYGLIKQLRKYTEHSRWFNTYLRSSDKTSYPGVLQEKYGYRISSISKLMLNAPANKEQFVVYRGIAPYKGFSVDIGTTLKDDAPVSTTYDRSEAVQFIEYRTHEDLSNKYSVCCLFEITVPPNSRFICVESISKHPQEREILFPAGTSMTITGKTMLGNIVMYRSTLHTPALQDIVENRILSTKEERIQSLKDTSPAFNGMLEENAFFTYSKSYKDLDDTERQDVDRNTYKEYKKSIGV